MEVLAFVASVMPSKLLLFSPSQPRATATATTTTTTTTEKNSLHLLQLLRGCLLLALHALLLLLRLASLSVSPVLSSALRQNSTTAATSLHLHDTAGRLLPPPSGEEGRTYVARALSHVLAVVTRIPVASRKYELARGLADRLLDENLRCGSPALATVNCDALTAAFSRTLHRLEAAALHRRGPGAKADRSVERILGGVRSWLRPWADPLEEEEEGGGSAEKLAAEALWLAEKMAACGAAREAVARWGAAAGLARLALAAEPRLQGTFVRIAAFLFKHASSKELEGGEGRERGTMAMMPALCHQMDMLTSWLPLLCRASNGMDAPVLSRTERAETVSVLEEIIENLSWDQQEEVLFLWLHHFTSCPDSDWPDLQPCYTRWYSVSRKLLAN